MRNVCLKIASVQITAYFQERILAERFYAQYVYVLTLFDLYVYNIVT